MRLLRLPNGYGSITKMSGRRRNKWRVYAPTIICDDKIIRKTIGYYATREEALKCLADYHNNPTIFKSKDLTVLDLYNKWLSVHKETISEISIRNYNSTIKRLTPIHNKNINDVNLNILQNLISNLSDGVKKATKTVLIMIFDYAIKLDMLEKNYAKYIEIGEVSKSVIRNVYTQPQIAHLWQCSRDFEAKCLLVLIYSGMRVNELVHMERENVYLDKNYMIGGSKTKAGKNRVIPIHEYTKPIIEYFYNQQTDLLLDFNKTVNTLIAYLRKYTDDKGIKHTTHDTRYTFASLMESAGVPLLTTQKIMGHSAGNITQDIYTKINYEELVEAVNKIKVK